MKPHRGGARSDMLITETLSSSEAFSSFHQRHLWNMQVLRHCPFRVIAKAHLKLHINKNSKFPKTSVQKIPMSKALHKINSINVHEREKEFLSIFSLIIFKKFLEQLLIYLYV